MECGARRLRHPQMSRGTDCRKLSRGISNTNPLPFHDGAEYPYTNETQGNRSSAGIPSLLESPLSQPPAPGMTPSGGASVALPFKFRPRRESVDWRRIHAVDVDLVVSQLDLDALEEHIGSGLLLQAGGRAVPAVPQTRGPGSGEAPAGCPV
uniref:zinc finger protein Dzip1-like n=1 Tax=Gasterosteus aculeatus aculeatus TaxID=481459 RepID=UPI001A98580C|nr:zinc finger protein Dzip1-like [Gasterosteus aculeatus aculeatus]